jgi:predicted O-linked N-acetylglucosamine transferase (SPINDLY family)
MRGRLASGIMRRMNMPELVAATDDAFVEMAIRLAADGAARARLRSQIETRAAILFRDAEPVRALERLLRESAVGA